MPYNTTAIPPRKEATGQTQLPLSRVKKIVAVDPDISICSNNAAFVITLATEMFVQHLAAEGQNVARTDRKPRRNLQYKDLAQAVLRQESLEFLEDVIPRTAPYKQIKEQAAATQAKLRGDKTRAEEAARGASGGGGKRQKSIVNGSGSMNGFGPASRMLADEDPDAQLQMEMQRAETGPDGDVVMID